MIRGQQLLAGGAALHYHMPVWDALCIAYAACLRNCHREDDVLELDGWVTVTVEQAAELARDEWERRQRRARQFVEAS